jgi:hypothetical protein
MPALDPEADLRGISNELSTLSTTLLSEAAQSLPRAVEVSRSHISVAQRGDLYGTLIPGAFFSSRFLMGSCRCLLCGREFSIAIREGVPTMFTIQHSLSGHAAHGEWQHTKAMQVAALLGTLIVVGVIVFVWGLQLRQLARPSGKKSTGWLATTNSLAHLCLIRQRVPTHRHFFISNGWDLATLVT